MLLFIDIFPRGSVNQPVKVNERSDERLRTKTMDKNILKHISVGFFEWTFINGLL